MKRLFISAGLLAISALTAAEFHLVRDAEPTAQFQLENNLDPDSMEQINRFNSYLKKVTGTTLPKNGKALSYTIQIVIDKNVKLGKQHDWKIEFPSENVMKITASNSSIFQALNMLLEKGADTRFLGVENCMFQFEPKKNVSVAAKPMKSAEGFSVFRGAWFIPNHNIELGIFDKGGFQHNHGIPTYSFPPGKYAKTGWPAAVMPVLRGKKLVKPPANVWNNWQPCYSNPETAKEAAKNILEILRRKPVSSISLGVNDNGGFCQCDNCLKMDKGLRPGIFVNDRTNRAHSYYTFVNGVAEIVCKEFPDLKIGLLAYTGTIMPPAFKVHKNVVPVMTLDSVLSALDPAVKAKHYGVIKEWGTKVAETGIWDYCWGRHYMIPRVNFKNHAELLKYLYANGGRAYFAENSGMADAIDGPKTYLVSRLLKDINADPEQILEEWYTRYAGKDAAPYLKKIYLLCEEYWTSAEMKKTPIFRARNYIYMYPNENHMFALKPGFTKELVDLAAKVHELAKTPGEKTRAAILLRQMENIDCVASFKGMAYRAADNGEFRSVKDTLAYFDFLKSDLPRLLAQHKRATAYFSDPDLKEGQSDIYLTRRLYEPDESVLLSAGLLKSLRYLDSKEVTEGLKSVAELSELPKSVKDMIGLISQGDKVKNHFSNPGLEKPLSSMKIKTSVPFEIAGDVLCNGQKTIKILPAHPNGVPNPDDVMLSHIVSFTITEELPPGIWAVSLKVKTPSKQAIMDLSLWSCTNGVNNNWEDLRQIRIPANEWQVFTQVATVMPRHTGANIIIRPSNFKVNEPLYIGDIRLIRIGDAANEKAKASKQTFTPSKFVTREGSTRGKLFGKDAVINSNPKGYSFAHAVFNWNGRKDNAVMEVSLNAARPADSKSGKIGIIIYEWKNNNWAMKSNILWNKALSNQKFEQINLKVNGKTLGNGNKFLMIFFKMRGTEAVAISDMTLKMSPVKAAAQTAPAKPVKKGVVRAIPNKQFFPRMKSSRQDLFGKKAVVNTDPNGYDFAHFSCIWNDKKADSVMEVTLNAARPADSKSGKIGAIIYEKQKNTWVQKANVLWGRDVSNKGFAPVKFSVKAKDLGSGNNYLMIFYKMRGTEAVAISDAVLTFK